MASATLQEQLAEIKIVLDAIRLLPIAAPLKRDMLDCALWKVAHATGNTQHKFMGRYRSETVTTQAGSTFKEITPMAGRR